MVSTARGFKRPVALLLSLLLLVASALWAEGPCIALTYAAEKLAAVEAGRKDP